jgi:hypothetical protein
MRIRIFYFYRILSADLVLGLRYHNKILFYKSYLRRLPIVEDRLCTYKYIYRNMCFTVIAPVRQLIFE